MPTQSVERKLAAIFAADIAGYSVLMGANEVATVRDLKAHQTVILPMVSAHSGRIIDTAGDGYDWARVAAEAFGKDRNRQ